MMPRSRSRYLWGLVPLALLIGFAYRREPVKQAKLPLAAPSKLAVARKGPDDQSLLGRPVVATKRLVVAADERAPAAPAAPAAPQAGAPIEVTDVQARMLAAPHALPVPSEAALQERDAVVSKLMGGGAGGEHWLPHFESVEREWLALDSKAGIGVDLTPWDCFKDGCMVTVKLPSVEAQERFSALVMAGSATKEWKGGGFHSGPIRNEAGEIETTWVFYAPPAA